MFVLRAAVAGLLLLLGGCATKEELRAQYRKEYDETEARVYKNIAAAKPHIKKEHLDKCEHYHLTALRLAKIERVSEFFPGIGNTCMMVERRKPKPGEVEPIRVVYVAKARVTSLWRESIHDITCAFTITDGNVKLHKRRVTNTNPTPVCMGMVFASGGTINRR